jgi:hypothetical protein
MLHEEPHPFKNESPPAATGVRVRLPPAASRWTATLLVLALAALAGAWAWIELSPILPLGLGTCFSVRLLGQPCPMCGLTRGLHAVWQGNLTSARAFHPLSLSVFILLVTEGLFRIVLLTARFSPERWKQLARADFLVHAALGSAYFGYAIAWLAHRYLL